ncbi:helix-turn-helix domain-containing protein [Cytobacillus firmus]|uniref:helix-turn-helix domain-containing protein n=1 Tax=Cytobacillus firmus TaxID=1399 RepID=UPI002162537E|nr:helix-turn-helix domain-containing protein [Cytobacillus firmus]MCS0674620.1 helix-turn-helix domain-containing protein [Cytobacillus firmus]
MKDIDQYPDVLNVSDIQEILGVGRRQAYDLVSSGQFHTVRIGKRIKVFKAVFVSWLYGNHTDRGNN